MSDKDLSGTEEAGDKPAKADKRASSELEKSFGLGVAKKSFIVSRGFSLNEIVKAGN